MKLAATETTWRGDDFPSWLSPMVVKELRQGVQSGTFAWTFIGLQAAMFLALAITVTAFDAASQRSTQTLEFFFWPLVGIAVLVVIPLCGLGAISSEQAGSKLDLVRLTRLSATKIVLGKWLAIVAQAALIVTAILPYVVLRYFFGNVNVLSDLATIGWLFAGSMIVAAAAIAVSTKPLWQRIAVSVLAVPSLVSLMELLDNPRASRFVFGSWVGLLAILSIYTVALLQYAASTIAPPAENHALRKRSLGLAIGLLWGVFAGWAAPQVAMSMILATLPLLIFSAIEAVLEQPVHLKSQAAAFARFGVVGRLVARLLTPGWATGLVYVLVMTAICLPAICWLGMLESGTLNRDVMRAVACGILIPAAVLFPLPMIYRFRKPQLRFGIYCLVHLASVLAYVFTLAAKPLDIRWQDWPIGWMWLLPLPAASLGSLTTSGGSLEISMACCFAGSIIIAVVCLAMLLPWWKEMRELGRLLNASRVDPLRQRAVLDGSGTV